MTDNERFFVLMTLRKQIRIPLVAGDLRAIAVGGWVRQQKAGDFDFDSPFVVLHPEDAEYVGEDRVYYGETIIIPPSNCDGIAEIKGGEA